jgi:hypothetical protein
MNEQIVFWQNAASTISHLRKSEGGAMRLGSTNTLTRLGSEIMFCDSLLLFRSAFQSLDPESAQRAVAKSPPYVQLAEEVPQRTYLCDCFGVTFIHDDPKIAREAFELASAIRRNTGWVIPPIIQSHVLGAQRELFGKPLDDRQATQLSIEFLRDRLRMFFDDVRLKLSLLVAR